MNAQVIETRHAFPAHPASGKSRRLAILLAILVTISIAINATIIVAAGSGP